MKRSDEVPWRQTPTPRLYPWSDWFNGAAWLLTADDYDGALPAFRARLYHMAHGFGYRLRTRVAPEGIYIQALAMDGSELPPLS